jgi:hypothetical protein
MPALKFLPDEVRANIGGLKHRWGADDFETHEKRRSPYRNQSGGVMARVILVVEKPGRFRAPGYFVYDPTADKSRGSDVER